MGTYLPRAIETTPLMVRSEIAAVGFQGRGHIEYLSMPHSIRVHVLDIVSNGTETDGYQTSYCNAYEIWVYSSSTPRVEKDIEFRPILSRVTQIYE